MPTNEPRKQSIMTTNRPVDHGAMASTLLTSAVTIARQAHEWEGEHGRQAYASTLATMAIAESILALAHALTYEDASPTPLAEERSDERRSQR